MDETPSAALQSCSSDGNCRSCVLTAKFHNTGPTEPDRTGPDQTKSAHFVGDRLNFTTRARPDPHGLFLWPGSPRNSVGSVRVSDKVGAVGSHRARVVKFSLYRVRGVDGSCAEHLAVESYTIVMLLTFILIIISIPSPLTLQILPTAAFPFFFRTDSTDFPACLLLLLSISVFFYFFSFCCFTLLVVGSVR